MRPDQSGAIVLLSLPWHGHQVICAIPAGQRIPQRTLDWLKQYAQDNARPLIFYERLVVEGEFSGLKRFGYGPPQFKRLVAEVAAADPEGFLNMRSG